MTPSEVLRAAKAKIEKPEHWAQGFYAFRPVGKEPIMGKVQIMQDGRAMESTTPADPLAECWCVRGAVAAVTQTVTNDRSLDYLPAALRTLTMASPLQVISLAALARFNDAPVRRHIEVIQLLDIAIRLAEEDEQADDHPEAHK